jgi:hypothetical protein
MVLRKDERNGLTERNDSMGIKNGLGDTLFEIVFKTITNNFRFYYDVSSYWVSRYSLLIPKKVEQP